MDSAAAGLSEAIPHGRAIHRHLRHADLFPYCHGQSAGSGADRLARPVERAGADGIAAVLGMDVGSDGAYPCNPHHCGDQGRLRSRGKLAAGGPLAQRLGALLTRCDGSIRLIA